MIGIDNTDDYDGITMLDDRCDEEVLSKSSPKVTTPVSKRRRRFLERNNTQNVVVQQVQGAS